MTFMLSLLGGFVLAVLEFVLTLIFAVLDWLLRLLWPAFVIVTIVSLLALSAQSAHAGWFDWFWSSDTEQLERSTEIAQEAARVTSASTIAQAEQASAQATQNARVAELLSHLSDERHHLAGHIKTLAEMHAQDSQWAAALSATTPIVICVAVLFVAGLALWAVTRTSPQDQAELSDAIDFLAMEVAANDPTEIASGSLLPPRSMTNPLRALMGPGNRFPDMPDLPLPTDDDEDQDEPPPF
jgi:ABC-type multidrug transport system fused ATPase/permease subunit